MKRYLLIFSLLCSGSSGLIAQEAPERLDDEALSQLAVQEHGRKKPFTTFAREMLLTLSGYQKLPVNPTETLSPEQVILNLWLKPEGWDERPLILVTHLQLRQRLGLPLGLDQKLFAFKDLVAKKEFSDLLDETEKMRQQGKGDDLTPLQKESEHLAERLKLFADLVSGEKERLVPASTPEGAWSSPLTRGVDDKGQSYTQISPLAGTQFTDWVESYRVGDLNKFNQQTRQLAALLREKNPGVYPTEATLAFEYHYMTLHPFRWAWIIYLIALLTIALSTHWFPRLGYRLTWAAVLGGLAFEIHGLYCRVVISGRPPVTDMYETVIWVSFIVMVFSILLEAIYRRRYFFYAGIPASVLTLIIADTQPTLLDSSINPLTAVLRNNMWLTIHVLTIVSSYAAFLLAGALGVMALILQMRGRSSQKEIAEVHLYVYRAMQIGVLLLATGTILGGVWANYSWGRFWGWDPKETWALITLLCYLALLHGRLAGIWSGFGLAFGSVLCFLSVLMSWYGVNYVLGKGLHSYGFGSGGFGYALGFTLTLLGFLAVAYWQIKLRPKAKV